MTSRLRERHVVRVTLRRCNAVQFDGHKVNLRKVVTSRSQTRTLISFLIMIGGRLQLPAVVGEMYFAPTEVRMKKQKSSKMGLRFGILLLTISLLCTWPFWAFFIAPPINDFRAFVFSRQFADLPLPPSTELVEIRHRVEPNGGNGDYCYFVGVAVLQSSLTERELDDFYSSPEVMFTPTIFTGERTEKRRIQTWIKPIENTDNLFELIVPDGTHHVSFDTCDRAKHTN